MTVHMVRLYIEDSAGQPNRAIDQWVQNHREWEDDPVEHNLGVKTTEAGFTYLHGDYRFLQDTGRTSLLDDLETRLQRLSGGVWYRAGYHVCTHSEGNGGPCTWSEDETREDGEVPVVIPTIEAVDHPDAPGGD